MKNRFTILLAMLGMAFLVNFAQAQKLKRVHLIPSIPSTGDVRAFIHGVAQANSGVEYEDVSSRPEIPEFMKDLDLVCVAYGDGVKVSDAEADYFFDGCAGGEHKIDEEFEASGQWSFCENLAYAHAPEDDQEARGVSSLGLSTSMDYRLVADEDFEGEVKVEGQLKIKISGDNPDTIETSFILPMAEVQIDRSYIRLFHKGDGKFRVKGKIYKIVDGENQIEIVDRLIDVGEEPVEVSYTCQFMLTRLESFMVETDSDLSVQAHVKGNSVHTPLFEDEPIVISEKGDPTVSGEWTLESTADFAIVD